MIQPKTLESLNYFIDEDIQNCKDSLEEFKDSENLVSFYRGQIVGLEYTKQLINQEWKSEHQLAAQDYYNSMTREELKQVLTEAGFEVEDGEGKVIFTESNNKGYFSDKEYKSSNELLAELKEIQEFFNKDNKKPPKKNRPQGMIIKEGFKKDF